MITKLCKCKDVDDVLAYINSVLDTIENTVTETVQPEVRITDFIDKVIFNDTATVVVWQDGSKSIVKKHAEDNYDIEKGLALAILKGLLGNGYYKDMKKLIDKYKVN